MPQRCDHTSGPRRAGSFHGQASYKKGTSSSSFTAKGRQISPNGISDSFWASLCNRSNSTASSDALLREYERQIESQPP